MTRQRCVHPGRPAADVLQAGFTLLELMIVLFIIGLATSLSVAMLAGGDGQRHEARIDALRSEFRLARDTARHTRQVIGWRLDGARYRYLRLQGASEGPRWVPLAADGLNRGDWPETLRFESVHDEREPQVIWWPNGESSRVRLTFAWADQRRVLALDGLGRIDLEGHR